MPIAFYIRYIEQGRENGKGGKELHKPWSSQDVLLELKRHLHA